MRARSATIGCIVAAVALSLLTMGAAATTPGGSATADNVSTPENITFHYGDETTVEDVTTYDGQYVAAGTWDDGDASTGFVRMVDPNGTVMFHTNLSSDTGATKIESVTVGEDSMTAVGETPVNGTNSPWVVRLAPNGTVRSETPVTNFDNPVEVAIQLS